MQSAQAPVQQAQQTVFQTQPPPVVHYGGAVDSTGALSCHLRPPVLEEAAVARMEGEPLLHSLPSMLAPTGNRHRVRHSPFR